MTNAEARFNKIHIRKVYANLAFGRMTGIFYETRGWTDTEIRVSTESDPGEENSHRDSNPRPFNHESGALTTELFCQNCQNGLYGREVWTNIRPQCVYQIQTPLFLLYD